MDSRSIQRVHTPNQPRKCRVTKVASPSYLPYYSHTHNLRCHHIGLTSFVGTSLLIPVLRCSIVMPGAEARRHRFHLVNFCSDFVGSDPPVARVFFLLCFEDESSWTIWNGCSRFLISIGLTSDASPHSYHAEATKGWVAVVFCCV